MSAVRERDFVEIFEKKGFTREETNLIIDYLAKTSATRADLKDCESSLKEEMKNMEISFAKLNETMSVKFYELSLYIDTVRKELDGKIDYTRLSLEKKIDAVDAKIDGVEQRLDAKIDGVRSEVANVKCELEKKIVQESQKQLIWVIGAMATIISIALTIFGLVMH